MCSVKGKLSGAAGEGRGMERMVVLKKKKKKGRRYVKLFTLKGRGQFTVNSKIDL